MNKEILSFQQLKGKWKFIIILNKLEIKENNSIQITKNYLVSLNEYYQLCLLSTPGFKELNMGKGGTTLKIKNMHIWIFNHCPYRTMMLSFINRGSGSLQTIQLHYLAVIRQVHRLLMSLWVFLSNYLQSTILITLAWKAKILLS